MNIKTKYEPGQHIWHIEKSAYGYLEVYDTYIAYILADEKGFIYRTYNPNAKIKEDDIILYEDKEKLYKVLTKMCKK